MCYWEHTAVFYWYERRPSRLELQMWIGFLWSLCRTNSERIWVIFCKPSFCSRCYECKPMDCWVTILIGLRRYQAPMSLIYLHWDFEPEYSFNPSKIVITITGHDRSARSSFNCLIKVFGKIGHFILSRLYLYIVPMNRWLPHLLTCIEIDANNRPSSHRFINRSAISLLSSNDRLLPTVQLPMGILPSWPRISPRLWIPILI